MAEFKIKCSHCGTELLAEEEWLGMETTCPECNKNFVIQKYVIPQIQEQNQPFQEKAQQFQGQPQFQGQQTQQNPYYQNQRQYYSQPTKLKKNYKFAPRKLITGLNFLYCTIPIYGPIWILICLIISIKKQYKTEKIIHIYLLILSVINSVAGAILYN